MKLVICWDVNGFRDCHTEWSKSEREKQISYINACMCNLENGTDEPVCREKLRHRCREQTYGHQGGKTVVGWGWWCAELGDWDWHVYTDVYKIDD